MGQAAIQVIYSKDRSKIVQLEHMPIETLRAEKCDADGNVPAYYYCNDWANIKKSDKPLRIPAFGMSKESIEIYYIKPYKSRLLLLFTCRLSRRIAVLQNLKKKYLTII